MKSKQVVAPVHVTCLTACVLLGGWASSNLAAAEPPLTPAADTLLDSGADRFSAIERSLVREPALAALAPMQFPVGETDCDEQRGQILRPVPRMMSDSKLDPVGNLGPAGMLPAIQSHMLSRAELEKEISALFGSPQQGVMTLDRGY